MTLLQIATIIANEDKRYQTLKSVLFDVLFKAVNDDEFMKKFVNIKPQIFEQELNKVVDSIVTKLFAVDK